MTSRPRPLTGGCLLSLKPHLETPQLPGIPKLWVHQGPWPEAIGGRPVLLVRAGRLRTLDWCPLGPGC